MKQYLTKNEINELVAQTIEKISKDSRFPMTKEFMQHGKISVYEHCVEVAYTCAHIARKLKLAVDYHALVRGALLHDYFLYDWHYDGDNSHKLHGFTHPKRAFDNALHDFKLNHIEKNIILRHMFPLTLIPPMTRESWLVCLADKICATKETLHQTASKNGHIYGSIRKFRASRRNRHKKNDILS